MEVDSCLMNRRRVVAIVMWRKDGDLGRMSVVVVGDRSQWKGDCGFVIRC